MYEQRVCEPRIFHIVSCFFLKFISCRLAINVLLYIVRTKRPLLPSKSGEHQMLVCFLALFHFPRTSVDTWVHAAVFALNEQTTLVRICFQKLDKTSWLLHSFRTYFNVLYFRTCFTYLLNNALLAKNLINACFQINFWTTLAFK